MVFSASSKGKSPEYSKTWDWDFGVARAFSVVNQLKTWGWNFGVARAPTGYIQVKIAEDPFLLDYRIKLVVRLEKTSTKTTAIGRLIFLRESQQEPDVS